MLRFFLSVLLLFLVSFVFGCVTSGSPAKHDDHSKVHAQYTPYNAEAAAWSEVHQTLAKAQANDRLALIVMGANWCHDSRGLAAQFDKERFKTELLDPNYELLYVDVGKKNRNIDIAQKFGVDDIVGTPTVFIVHPDGEVLNLETAPTWRNADSRSEDEIFDYFMSYAQAFRAE